MELICLYLIPCDENFVVFKIKRTTPEACIHASTSPRPTRCEPMDAQAAVASSARNLSAGPPSLPTFDNEKLVCFVDAAWDASTRNCGMAGVFKGREQGKFRASKTQGDMLIQPDCRRSEAVRRLYLIGFHVGGIDSARR
ncbi:hypothetical protein Bca52824_026011 [Brassica carinata]|uniref:Uncharacterized protein n=1 Tax=Brassica carinata TaxID=52824 RepID=A0A8X7SFI1_BRACI|nr:hypothetical protein Bca52824_026011 [Brassica carinata]